MFVSPTRLTPSENTLHGIDTPLNQPIQSQIEELVHLIGFPDTLKNASVIEKLNWSIGFLTSLCPEELRKTMKFDSEILGRLLSVSSAMPALQFILYHLDTHSQASQDPEKSVLELLRSLSWPEGDVFVKVSVLAAFSLFKPSLALPCLVQLYEPESHLQSLLSYLSTYFSTILSSCLHSNLDQILQNASIASPKSIFAQLTNTISLLDIPNVFESVLRHWSGSRNESAVKLDHLSNWLLDLSDLAISLSNGINMGLLPVIIEHSESNDGLLLASMLMAAGRRRQDHPLFELVSTYFFQGLISLICHQSSNRIRVLRRVVFLKDAERCIPQERLREWRNFEMVTSQYASNGNASDRFANSMRQVVVIEKAKQSAPVPEFSSATIQFLFDSTGSRLNIQISDDASASREIVLPSIETATFEEIGYLLNNIWTISKSENILGVPFDWLLSLVDQGPFEIAFMAQAIIEYLLEHSSAVRVHLFSAQLLDYFESLSLAAYSSVCPLESKGNGNFSKMDVDEPHGNHDNLEKQLPTTIDKLHIVRGLFNKMKHHRSVISFLISDIITRLCVGDISKIPHSLPSLRKFDSKTDSSETETQNYNRNSYASATEGKSFDVLENIRKRSRADGNGPETTLTTSIASSSAHLKGLPAKRPLMTSGLHSSSSLLETGPLRAHIEPYGGKSFKSTSSVDAMQFRVELFALAENLALSASTSFNLSSSTPKPLTSSNTTPHKAPVGSGAALVTDLLPKVAETLVAQVDSRYHPIVNYEVYFEILPKKSVYDRDRQVEQLFLQRPVLWSVLELVSTRPSLLHSCRHIVLTLLVNLIGCWNAEPETTPVPNSFWFSRTLALSRIIDACPSFGVGQTKQLVGIHAIFEYCHPSEVTMILLGLFHFIVKRFASSMPSGGLNPNDDRMWALKPIKYVLRRNVHLLSEKALDFYIRTATPSKVPQANN